MITLKQVRESDATVLSVAQVAELLTDIEGHSIDGPTVRRACDSGQIPSFRVGSRVLIPREPLVALLSAPPFVPNGRAYPTKIESLRGSGPTPSEPSRP